MSNIIDKIRISGVTYTLNGTVSSAITSGDTNPVEGGVLYDELRIPNESGLTLEWYNHDGGDTTNYPSGESSRITFEVVASGGSEEDPWVQEEGWFYLCCDGSGIFDGYIHIAIDNNVVTASVEGDLSATCTVSVNGNIVTVEYPTIAENINMISSSYDNYWVTTAYVGDTAYIPLIDQVSANTIAISGKQDILSAGTNITISGNVISATGGGSGNPTVELTQAEYDALVSAGTVSANTYYIITDATPQDMSYYWTSAQTQSAITEATSGKVNTSSVVSSVTSASTNNEIPTAKAVYDAVGQGGGGKAIEAGTGIAITTGETADTVSLDIKAKKGSTDTALVFNYTNSNTATAAGATSFGYTCKATNQYTFANGNNTQAKGYYSHSEGENTIANGRASHSDGFYVNANNDYESSQGRYNVSSSVSTTFGNSGNTLFSVGNGTADNARHNAFEIRQNGDIYANNGTSDVKLQDYLQIKVVKLTQSAYDALSPNYDSNTLYIIKD